MHSTDIIRSTIVKHSMPQPAINSIADQSCSENVKVKSHSIIPVRAPAKALLNGNPSRHTGQTGMYNS
jgi:hypothetical protein